MKTRSCTRTSPKAKKLKSDKGRRSRNARRALKSLSLWTFLALKGLRLFFFLYANNLIFSLKDLWKRTKNKKNHLSKRKRFKFVFLCTLFSSFFNFNFVCKSVSAFVVTNLCAKPTEKIYCLNLYCLACTRIWRRRWRRWRW